jgi:hypothetical protein
MRANARWIARIGDEDRGWGFACERDWAGADAFEDDVTFEDPEGLRREEDGDGVEDGLRVRCGS